MNASSSCSAVIAYALVVGACGAAVRAPVARPDAEREIRELLDGWHLAAARADEDAYFACFAPEAVFLGTDATERWTVGAFREFAHPYFARGRAWTFRATRRDVMFGAHDDIAWFDEELETSSLGPARGSGVLVRGTDGRWKIGHYNLTLTIPNDSLDAVRAALRAADAAGP